MDKDFCIFKVKRLAGMVKVLMALCSFGLTEVACGQSLPPQSLQQEKYQLVVSYISDTNYSKAIAEARTLFKTTNQFPELYSRVILAAQVSGQIDEVKNIFQELLQSESTAANGYYGLGLIAHIVEKNYESALEYHKRSFAVRRDSPYPLFDIVNSLKDSEKLAQAKPYLDSLIAASPGSPIILMAIGYFYFQNKQFNNAIETMDLVEKLAPGLPETCYYKILLQQRISKNVEALKVQDICFLSLKASVHNDLYQDFQILKAISYLNLGYYENSAAMFRQILNQSRKTNDSKYEEVSLAYLGLICESQDEYSLALSYYNRGFEIAQRKDSVYGITNLKVYPGRIGRIHYLLDDYSKAEQLFNEGLKIVRNAKDALLEILLLTYLGDNYLRQNNIAMAISNYRLAVEAYKNRPNTLNQSLSYDLLSQTYRQIGDYQQAQDYINRGLAMARESNFFEAELFFLNRRGEIYLELYSPQLAAEAFQDALVIATDKKSHRERWKSLIGLGRANQMQFDYVTAREKYLEAIQAMEPVRRQITGDEEKAGFFQNKVKIYKDLIATLIELHGKEAAKGYDAEAFDYAERARGRGFLDLLAEAKVNLDQNLEPALLEKRQIIENEISRINSELVAERSKELPRQDSARLNQLEKALNDANGKLDNWIRDVKLSDPRYAAIKFPEPIKLSEAQKLLDERSAMLAFSLGEQESFLFAVTRNDYRIFKLKSSATIRRNVDDLLSAIQGKGRANSPIGTFKTSARELYQSLIEPAKEMLAGKSELIVIPDESLHRLPFETLLTAQPDGKWEQLPYLVRDFAISYAPSVSVLAFLKTQSQRVTPKDFIAFGDPVLGKDDQMNDQTKMLASTISNNRGLSVKPERPGFWRKLFGSSTRGASTGPLKFDRLPFSREEAIEIAKLFSTDKADVFLGKDATEEKAKSKDLLSQYGIVHFSTHGLPNEDRPRFSSLIMSSPTKGKTASETIEDGWLSAYEIFNLKLNANLVVLSACETGLGKEIKGEGLMSLTRAFMYAGAPSVVVSLWKVNDSASKDLMVAFYRNLQQPVNGEKLSYSEALRRAQLEMIAKGNAPKLWAPFVLIGRP